MSYYIGYHIGAAGKTYYVKPTPTVSSPWTYDVVSGIRNGTTNEIAFALDSSLSYIVYEQASTSPASSDKAIYSFDPEGCSSQSTAPTSTPVYSQPYTVTIGDVGSIVTLCDIVSAIIDRSMGDEGSSRLARLATTAVQSAIRDLPKKHKWQYFNQIVRFAASAQQKFTVNYTQATRVMQISGGATWPIDASLGEIVFRDGVYSIAKRNSDSSITLAPESSLGADYVGEVIWQRSRYTFNREFSKLNYLVNFTERQPLRLVTNSDLYEQRNYATLSGSPTFFSIRGSSIMGATDVVIMPAPQTPDVFEALVFASPVIPSVYKISASDGAISSGTDVFTSATAKFTKQCVGTLLRLYDDAEDIPFGTPTWHSVITEYIDAHTVRIADAYPTDGTDLPFVASSMVDIEPGVMLTYVQNESYANYCMNHDHKLLGQAKTLAKESLLSAIAADGRVNTSRGIEYNWARNIRPTDYARVIIN